MLRKQLLNSIFHPRQSNIKKDDKDHIVEVEKNASVGLRFFLKDKSFPNILLFHGNGELAQEYNDIGDYFNMFGMNLIVADYRGYGLSDGTPDKDNLHDDALTLFKYVNKYIRKNEYNDKIIIMGRSLGSASAAHIIHKHQDIIDGCVIESGFATEIPLLKLYGIDPDTIGFKLIDGFENLRKFKQYSKPLYVIHADLDSIIPFSQAEIIILENKSKMKDLFRVSGADHNNIFHIAREDYFSNIKIFIDSIK